LAYRPLNAADDDRGFVLEQRDLVRGLAVLGSTFARAGDFARGVQAVDLSLKLSTSIFLAGGDSFDYVPATAMLQESYAGIRRVVRLPKCPIAICHQWLA